MPSRLPSARPLAADVDGTAGDNQLVGTATDDTLRGFAGDDTLEGLAGNDELDGGTGFDLAVYAAAGTAVTVSLLQSGAQATGGSGRDTLISIEGLVGSAFDDKLAGNGGANVIDGGSGRDQLTGRGGRDSFAFSSALDGARNIDHITDFKPGTDKITLARDIFGEAGAPGSLRAAAFHTGTAAHDASDRIVYDPASGRLYYDADGSGAGAAIGFASVTAGLVLAANDFILV